MAPQASVTFAELMTSHQLFEPRVALLLELIDGEADFQSTRSQSMTNPLTHSLSH